MICILNHLNIFKQKLTGKINPAGILLLVILLSSCTLEDPTELIDDRDAFIGTWNVVESCTKDYYQVNITKDPGNSSQVTIQNFWNIPNCSNPPYAIIAGSSIVIPSQSICSDNFEVGGSGSMSKSKINLTFTVNDGADLYTCTATLEPL
jgi:hypothetical protein